MLVPLFTPNLTDYKVTAELTCIFHRSFKHQGFLDPTILAASLP